jgi:hypothetical protein
MALKLLRKFSANLKSLLLNASKSEITNNKISTRHPPKHLKRCVLKILSRRHNQTSGIPKNQIMMLISL